MRTFQKKENWKRFANIWKWRVLKATAGETQRLVKEIKKWFMDEWSRGVSRKKKGEKTKSNGQLYFVNQMKIWM